MSLKTEKITPIEYGRLACDSIMNMYEPCSLPPKGVLFYHQGVFLSGMQRVYQITGEKKYFDYIKEYADSVLGKNGELIGFVHELNMPETPALAKQALQMLDHKQATTILYDIFDETGDEKYIKPVIESAKSMHYWPVNNYGGYWHMMTQPNQMWLDGAYMAGPLSVMYAKRFGDTVLRDRAVNQVIIMDKFMKDKKTGLYFHGWDDSENKMPWADKKTGLSQVIWGRAVGWYAVAILDILEYIPKDHPKANELKRIEKELLTALEKYQDKKTGMWFEVLDKIYEPNNWTESSCTNLFIYSYAKAIRMGIIEKSHFEDVLIKAYEGSINSLTYDENGNLQINDVCSGTCIEEGTYEYYINRPKVTNDLHGAGAFILMCSEMQKLLDAGLICVN